MQPISTGHRRRESSLQNQLPFCKCIRIDFQSSRAQSKGIHGKGLHQRGKQSFIAVEVLIIPQPELEEVVVNAFNLYLKKQHLGVTHEGLFVLFGIDTTPH